MSQSVISLGDLVHLLNPMVDKYFELGVQLGIDVACLKQIEGEHSSHSRRLYEVIYYWQNNATNTCGWSTLANAVAKIQGHENLARELRARGTITKEPSSCDSAAESSDGSLKNTEEIPKCKAHSPRLVKRSSCDIDDSVEILEDTGYSTKGDSLSDESSGRSDSDTESFDLVPGCGCKDKPCSVYTLCAGGCPNPTTKKVHILRKSSCATSRVEFPFEEEDDHEDYESKTKMIQKSFGRLVMDTCNSFKKSEKVTTQNLALFIRTSFPIMKPRTDELNKAECLEQIFDTVVDQACSWFDYEIIKDMIDYFGDPSDKSRVEKYEEEFKKYSRERLPRGKKHIEVGNGSRKGCKQLVIKIDKEWEEINFSDLKKLCGSFASILGVRRRDLYLADIREGCIMMTFMIPEEIASVVFPTKRQCLTLSQIQSFKDRGTISLKCGKFCWRAASCIGEAKDKEGSLTSSQNSQSLRDDLRCMYKKWMQVSDSRILVAPKMIDLTRCLKAECRTRKDLDPFKSKVSKDGCQNTGRLGHLGIGLHGLIILLLLSLLGLAGVSLIFSQCAHTHFDGTITFAHNTATHIDVVSAGLSHCQWWNKSYTSRTLFEVDMLQFLPPSGNSDPTTIRVETIPPRINEARQSSTNHDPRCVPANFRLCIDFERMGKEELTLRCTRSNLEFTDETVETPVTIWNFSEEYHGILRFEVKLADSCDRTETLLISPPPQAVVTLPDEIQNTFTATEGGTAILDCPMAIQPGALLQYYPIRWIKSNTPIVEFSTPKGFHSTDSRYSIDRSSFSLTINPVNVNDSDTSYNCEVYVKNPIGNNNERLMPSRQISLILNVLGEPSIVNGPQDVVVGVDLDGQHLTQNVIFTCLPIGLPPPVITWFYLHPLSEGDLDLSNPEQLTSNIINTKPGDESGRVLVTSHLTMPVTEVDGGVIRCRTGQEFREARLTVLGEPIIGITVTTREEIIYEIQLKTLIQYPVTLYFEYVKGGRIIPRNGPQPTEPFNNTRNIIIRENKDRLPCMECYVRVALIAMVRNRRRQSLRANSSITIAQRIRLQRVTISNSCGDITHGEGKLKFRLTLPPQLPDSLHQHRHSFPVRLQLNWTTFSDAPMPGEDSFDSTPVIDISDFFQNCWNGDRLIDLWVDRNAAVPDHVTSGVRTGERYRVQAKLIFNKTTAAEWSLECESPIYQPCLGKSDAEIKLKLSFSSKELQCSNYTSVRVKNALQQHLYELFECDPLIVGPVKEYRCSKVNVITFRANLKAYRAMEKVKRFYSHLEVNGMSLFNNSVRIEQYFPEVPHMMYVYIAASVLFFVLVSVIIIVAVKKCRRRSPKPKDIESEDKETEERRGNSSTSSSNHYVEDPQLSRSPTSVCSAISSVFTRSPQHTLRDVSAPPPHSPTPRSNSQSFASGHAPEESHSSAQYQPIPLVNVNEVIDLEDLTNDGSSSMHLQSHDPPAFMSRDSRLPSLVPSQQELELRECQQSRGESSALSDDVSLSQYERTTESPAMADSRSTPSSGYRSGQNVSPVCHQKHRHKHNTDGQPVTAVSVMSVPVNVTHVLLQCHPYELTRTCSASQLQPALHHHIGTSNLISVQPVSPGLSEEDRGETRDGREAISARSREHLHLTLNGARSFHRPQTELRTVVPNEVLSPNRRHSDPSPLGGSPREQHGLQGEQYSCLDTQTSSEADSSIL